MDERRDDPTRGRDARASRRRRARLGAGALAALGAGLLATWLARRRRAAARPEVRFEPAGADVEERRATVAGIRMRWLEHGHGRPLVLVHGIPTSPELWRRVLPRLRGAHAYAWEMVGYGASLAEGRGRDLSVARQADYLAAWLRQQGLQGERRPVLAGHDLGGGVVQIVAARHPELCAGLFLTNAIGYDSWPIPSVRALRAARSLVARLPPSALRALLSPLFRLGHDDARARRASEALHARHYRGAGAARAFARQIEALDQGDTLAVQDVLPHLNVPARVVWGAADRFQRLRYGERFARDLGTDLERIEGGLHFTPEDHPERIADALNALVAEVAAAEARVGPR